MDLALEERIDTDLEQLVLVDPAPLEDGLLDPTLADIARASRTHDTGYWVERTSRRADDIHDAALARLTERGIIEDDVPGLFFLSSRVARSRRYPAIDGKSVDDVRLRVMRILFEDDVPDPRDIAIICLADACGIVLTMATILRDVAPALDPPDYRLRIEHAPTPHPADSFRFRQTRRRE